MMSSNAHSQFYYCSDWDFSNLSEDFPISSMMRVCYVTTQVYRIYLVLSPCGVNLHPFMHVENKWIRRKLSDRITVPTLEEFRESEEKLKETMTSLLFLQFPKAEESYFETLPHGEEVLKLLRKNSVLSEVRNNFLVNATRFQGKNDEKGIITITIEEGVLTVPMERNDEGEYVLQVERAKIVPDGKVSYMFNKFSEFVEDLVSKAYVISWITFRRVIEDMYRMGVNRNVSYD